jgi:hypothetical protein
MDEVRAYTYVQYKAEIAIDKAPPIFLTPSRLRSTTPSIHTLASAGPHRLARPRTVALQATNEGSNPSGVAHQYETVEPGGPGIAEARR